MTIWTFPAPSGGETVRRPSFLAAWIFSGAGGTYCLTRATASLTASSMPSFLFSTTFLRSPRGFLLLPPDGAPASIRVLPEVVDAVGGQVQVLMDGGIRRGSDVVKAVALGADAVLIGRAYLWGLAANGQAGVENVIDILRDGMDATMRGLGKESVADLSPGDVVVPDGFCPPPV